jgi:hypothetical protein
VLNPTHNETIPQLYQRLKQSHTRPQQVTFKHASYFFRENTNWWKSGLVTLGFVERVTAPNWDSGKMAAIIDRATSLSVHVPTSPYAEEIIVDDSILHINHYWASQRFRIMNSPTGFVGDNSALPYVPRLFSQLQREFADMRIWHAVVRSPPAKPFVVDTLQGLVNATACRL